MSVSLMTEAFKADLPTVQKFVLVALCDNANDQGECYPSISRLMAKCSLSDRAVQLALAQLEKSGHLKREFLRGRATNYTITDPRTWFTPERGSPPNVVHPTPERRSPITIIEPSIEPSVNQEQGGHRSRVSSLPADWSLTDEYRQSAESVRPDWPAGHAETVAASFRDYWISQPGAKGVKLDWLATWRNWCRSDRGPPRGGGGGGKPSRHDLTGMDYSRGVNADGSF